MKKLLFTLVSIVLFIIAPITPDYQLLLSEGSIWITIVFVVVLNYTQPHIDENSDNIKIADDNNTVFFIVAASALSLVVPIIDWRLNNEPENYLVSLIGLIFCIFGLYLRYLAIRQLGKYFTAKVIIKNDHKLFKSGLYSKVRHPSYTGAMLAFASISLLFNSIIGLVTSLTAFFIAYTFRIRYEENILLKQFGEEYLQYKKSTFKIIPYLW